MKINQKTPEGWSVKKLKECFKFSAGGDVDKDCFSEFKDDSHPYPIYANALTNEGLYGYSSKYRIKEECITITGRGDIGKVFYRRGYFTPIVRLITAIPNTGINAKFMSYTCSKIKFFNESTGVPQLTVPQAQWYKVLIPPLAEQEKIAEILSCWDEGIENLSALIEKKKELKKGLMQQLLTGKTRLKGFTQPWKEVKLGELAEFVKGKQLNKVDMVETGIYPVLNGGITYSGYTDDWNTEKDTITVSEGGNSCGYVNYIKERFWCGGHCYVVNNIKINKLFMYHLLKFDEQDIMKLRVGSGLPNIQISSLNKFKIIIPSDISEQQAVAGILSKADDEIDLLNKKLDALKEQKKALMQQLLTGQIRVKVN